jgi:AraC family transcriptional regulator
LSAFHFARLFKNTLGLTTHQYVLQNRIERAKNLIVKFSHLNLTEIGLSVGFFDQAHFTKSFKRATGATPKAFLKHAA